MRRLVWIAVAGLVLVGLLAGAWMFRLEILMAVARSQQPKVGPNRPVAWALGPATAAAAPSERLPNIVFILADDLGANDVTFDGGGVADGAVPTPAIDSIARDGVNFVSGYTGNATCAPSRAAIMTGRYPTRFGFEFTPTPVLFSRLVGTFRSPGQSHPPRFRGERAGDMPPLNSLAVPASEITLAELLSAQGYHTVHLGKWHLGGAEGTRPEDQGFDESLGFIAGGSMFLPANDPNVVNSKQSFDPIDRFLWANLGFGVQFNGSSPFRAGGYMTDYLTDQAIAAIDANRNRPFFLYLAYNAPHTPLQATREDYDALSQIGDHRLRVYAAMIRNLDRNVGRVLEALRARGLDQNTLVIFTSDNGGAHYVGLPNLNRPYRGWKATFFEGGIRAPFYMRWPARIPAGTAYPRPVGHIDIFATAAAAAGAPLPTDRPIDGVDLGPYVSGAAAGDPHRALFWRSGGYRAVRAGDWKLQVLDDPAKVWLFDLASDPTERRNLAAANPAKVAELRALLDAQDAASVRPMWPSLLTGPVAIDHPLSVADKPGDEWIYWDN